MRSAEIRHDLVAAIAAVEHAGGDAVAAAPLGVFGHSQGGWVVVEAARLTARVAFVVTNSGPGVSPAEQERFSARGRMVHAGLAAPDIDATLTTFDLMLRLLRDRVPFADARARLDAAAIPAGPDLAELMFVPADELEWHLAGELIDHDPRPALSEIRVPLLAMFGGADTVVPVPTSVDVYRDAVPADLLTVAVFRGGDHRIQAGNPPRLVDGYLDTLSEFVARVRYR